MTEVLAGAAFLVGVVVIWCTDLPRDSVAHRLARPVLMPARWLGLGHSWRLFAPRPARGENHLVLEVMREDRTFLEIPYPPPCLCHRGRQMRGARKLKRNLLARSRVALRSSFVRFLVDHDVPEGSPVRTVRFRVERRGPGSFAELGADRPPMRTARPFFVDLEGA